MSVLPMEKDCLDPGRRIMMMDRFHPQTHAATSEDYEITAIAVNDPLITKGDEGGKDARDQRFTHSRRVNSRSPSQSPSPYTNDDDLAQRIDQRDSATWRSYFRMILWGRRSQLPPRSGRETYKDDFGIAAGEGLLADSRTYNRRMRRKRSWYHYCIFGGIGGSAILAILLVINLALISMTASSWSSDNDPALQRWGTPGSGTEGLDWYPTDFLRDVIPIPCHSHNDYWRRVPLFSALREGCTGTEADVWLIDEELFVGHNHASLTRNRTFQSLYINPIVKILEQQNPHSEFYNGTRNGVFDTNPDQSLILLVDVKTGGKETWPWVLKQLEPLRERDWLTFVEYGVLNKRPVTVVGTGNTPFDVLTSNTTYLDAFFDAPLEMMWEPRSSTSSYTYTPPSTLDPSDDNTDTNTEAENAADADTEPPPQPTDLGQGMTGVTANSSFTALNSYYASAPFGKAVGRLWSGRVSRKQLHVIRGHVRGAHRRGLKVRYWDLPSWPIGLRNHVWDVLVREGVDVLNVDDLRAVARMSW